MLKFILVGLSLAFATQTWVTAGPEPKAIIRITNFDFNPKQLTIPAGYTVIWKNEVGKHSIVADDGSFKSQTLNVGDTFVHTFDKAGTYPYYCGFHGSKGGHDMAASVVVTVRH